MSINVTESETIDIYIFYFIVFGETASQILFIRCGFILF